MSAPLWTGILFQNKTFKCTVKAFTFPSFPREDISFLPERINITEEISLQTLGQTISPFASTKYPKLWLYPDDELSQQGYKSLCQQLALVAFCEDCDIYFLGPSEYSAKFFSGLQNQHLRMIIVPKITASKPQLDLHLEHQEIQSHSYDLPEFPKLPPELEEVVNELVHEPDEISYKYNPPPEEPGVHLVIFDIDSYTSVERDLRRKLEEWGKLSQFLYKDLRHQLGIAWVSFESEVEGEAAYHFLQGYVLGRNKLILQRKKYSGEDRRDVETAMNSNKKPRKHHRKDSKEHRERKYDRRKPYDRRYPNNSRR